jgi:hypothetical protein
MEGGNGEKKRKRMRGSCGRRGADRSYLGGVASLPDGTRKKKKKLCFL